MVRPRTEGGQEKPGPRTEGGAPVNRPGSVYDKSKERDRDGSTVVELPSRDANVLVERSPGALGSPAYIGSGDLYGNIADPNSGYWVESLSVTDATASWASLPPETRQQIDRIAKMKWPTATGEGLWEKAVKGSAASNKRGQPMTAFDWIGEYSAGLVGNETGSGGAGTRGVGGSIGPRTSVSITSEADAEVLLQDAARQMIGRSLTDEELEKYTSRFRNREREAVTTTTSTPGSTVTEQGTSKETILSDLMQSNPDFGRYQIDTGFMDLFVNSIREGQAVINAGR